MYHPDSTCNIRTPRGKDRRQLGRTAPPRATYWLLAEPGRCYLAYARGLADELKLKLDPNAEGEYRARLYDPRSGAIRPVGGKHELRDTFTWTPPDSDDWVLHLVRADSSPGDKKQVTRTVTLGEGVIFQAGEKNLHCARAAANI